MRSDPINFPKAHSHRFFVQRPNKARVCVCVLFLLVFLIPFREGGGGRTDEDGTGRIRPINTQEQQLTSRFPALDGHPDWFICYFEVRGKSFREVFWRVWR